MKSRESSVSASLGSEKRRKSSVLQHHGPIEKRSCTDVICCMAFGAFVLIWFALSVLAFSWGNPKRLVYPTDSIGQICGTKTKFYDLRDKPFLFFFDLTACFDYSVVFSGCLTPQVCVSKCPEHYLVIGKGEIWPNQAWPELRSQLVCTSEVSIDSIGSLQELQAKGYLDNGKCASYYLESLPIGGRCVPKGMAEGWEKLSDWSLQNVSIRLDGMDAVSKKYRSEKAFSYVQLLLEAHGFLNKVLADLQVAWWQILVCLLIASAIAFLWIYVMQIIASITVWASIILTTAILIGLSAYSYYKYFALKSSYKDSDYSRKLKIFSMFRQPKTWLIVAIIFSILAAVFILSICCLFNRIRLAVALIAEASKAVSSMLSALFFPVFPFVLHLAVFTYWAFIAVHLASTGTPSCQYSNVSTDYRSTLGVAVANGSSCDCGGLLTWSGRAAEPFCQFSSYDQTDYYFAAQAFNFFAFLWLMAFASGFGDVVLAGAFASYYWALKKPDDLPYLPVIGSLKRTVRYHLGSIAFGSLILAIVQFIRHIVDYIAKKMQGAGPDNAVAKCLMKCAHCFLWLIEKFMRFLNKNAYIMIAIYGQNFYTSAKEAFTLIANNIVRVIVLNKITDFLIILGKFVVTTASGFVAYVFFAGKLQFTKHLVEHLSYPELPIIVVILGSYAICCSFFSVYDMAVDATFLCFLKDCEMNDGSFEKPYYMSDKLKNILHKRNKDSTASDELN